MNEKQNQQSRAMLSFWSKTKMTGWQAISTAPSDTTIDIWSIEYGRLPNYRRVELSEENVFFDPIEDGVCAVRDATHWMPMPETPKDSGLCE